MKNLKTILLIPVATYLISYIYIAFYHQSFLFPAIIHEEGSFTFLDYIFWTSHSLGHIPIHTVLAMYFVGCYFCLTEKELILKSKNFTLYSGIFLTIFLSALFLDSLFRFGAHETISYVLQKKYGVSNTMTGGSWNLHLPNILLLFAFIPVYIFAFKKWFHRKMRLNHAGVLFIGFSLGLAVTVSLLVNQNLRDMLALFKSDPFFNAHSIREIFTFSLVYFPIPLFVILKMEQRVESRGKFVNSQNLRRLIILLAIVFVFGLAGQLYVALTGVSDMNMTNQAFAVVSKKGVPYLLATHFFEHALDTVYFALAALFFYGIKAQKD